MFHTIITRIAWFLSLLVIQIFVCNHIHIMGYATPMPYIFALLILPYKTAKWLYLLLGFLLGLTIDIFGNTPGMAAASTTFLALLIPGMIKLYGPADLNENEDFIPSSKTMEWGSFSRYVITASFIQCACFFIIESFSFFYWEFLLINIFASTAITSLFMLAIELIRSK